MSGNQWADDDVKESVECLAFGKVNKWLESRLICMRTMLSTKGINEIIYLEHTFFGRMKNSSMLINFIFNLGYQGIRPWNSLSMAAYYFLIKYCQTLKNPTERERNSHACWST
jgi:hypothetical protein